MAYRSEKIASQLARELGQILAHEVRDPRLAKVLITQVTVSQDLKHARVLYGASIDTEDLDGLHRAMQKAKGFLRFRLGRVLALRVVPELDLRPDRGYWTGMDVIELLSKLDIDSDPASDSDSGER